MSAEFSDSRCSRVTVGVDSIIFDDELDVFRQAAERRAASADVMREFVARAAEDPLATRKWLTTLTLDRGHFDKTLGRPDYYKEAAVNTAADLLFMMDRLKPDHWVPSIQLKLAAPPPANQPHR